MNAARGATALTGFGTPGAAACNAAGIVAYQLVIPTALLYVGDPAAIGANINIDLFQVQQAVLRAL